MQIEELLGERRGRSGMSPLERSKQFAQRQQPTAVSNPQSTTTIAGSAPQTNTALPPRTVAGSGDFSVPVTRSTPASSDSTTASDLRRLSGINSNTLNIQDPGPRGSVDIAPPPAPPAASSGTIDLAQPQPGDPRQTAANIARYAGAAGRGIGAVGDFVGGLGRGAHAGLKGLGHVARGVGDLASNVTAGVGSTLGAIPGGLVRGYKSARGGERFTDRPMGSTGGAVGNRNMADPEMQRMIDIINRMDYRMRRAGF